MKKINNFWVDDNNNSWSCDVDTEESALIKSKSLIGCSGCSDCHDFKENPERITSKKIGSRNSQTTIYWTDQYEQVVCGCFKGNISEFKAKISETHGTNNFAVEYLNFIEKVENYRKY